MKVLHMTRGRMKRHYFRQFAQFGYLEVLFIPRRILTHISFYFDIYSHILFYACVDAFIIKIIIIFNYNVLLFMHMYRVTTFSYIIHVACLLKAITFNTNDVVTK